MGEWTFFSNHGHVLVCLARDREARLRDVAIQVGITERAVQKIVRDMQDEGYLEISKHGRRNRYRINTRKALRHPLQSGCTVGQLIQLLCKPEKQKSAPAEQVPAEPPVTQKPEPPASPKPVKAVMVEPEPEPQPEPEPEPEHKPEAVPPPAAVAAPEPPEPVQEQPAKSEPEPEPEKKNKKPSRADLEQGQLF